MKMNLKKGFTLIELLVVVAIIGILASVVLASLNTARNKGSDAAIKTNLANLRAQAAMFYDNNSNGYGVGNTAIQTITTTNSCATLSGTMLATTGTASTGDVTFCSGVVAAAVSSGNSALVNVLAQSWVVGVPLKQTPAAWRCVDSIGSSKTILTATTAIAAGVVLAATQCP